MKKRNPGHPTDENQGMEQPPVVLRRSTRLAEVSLGIVCPMANEGPAAVEFVAAVLAQCAEFKNVRFFAVLDRASTDRTLELLQAMQENEPKLIVVWAPENRCVVDAYVRGYREALSSGCDWILEIDAGFSHQPADIPRFFQAMSQGYDCVFGSRFMPGGQITESSVKRKLISRFGTLLTNLLLGTRLHDMTSGFELFSREAMTLVLEKGIESRGHFFQTEIKVHCRNLKIVEVPIHYKAASPRLGLKSIEDSLRHLWRLRRLQQAGKL